MCVCVCVVCVCVCVCSCVCVCMYAYLFACVRCTFALEKHTRIIPTSGVCITSIESSRTRRRDLQRPAQGELGPHLPWQESDDVRPGIFSQLRAGVACTDLRCLGPAFALPAFHAADKNDMSGSKIKCKASKW